MSFIVHRVAKHAARYIDGGGREKCGLCRFFVAPRACGKVVGPVSPMGWCKHYSRQMVSQFGGSIVGGGPSLLLDFMSPGTLDPRVTFTRASAATYFDSAGVLRSAAINAPRWDYDPVSHALRGLLIEEQRTNLVETSTGTFSPWSAGGTTLTPASGIAPDGTNAMSKLAEDATNSFHYLLSNYAIPAGASYSITVYAKQAERRWMALGFDDGSAPGATGTFDLQTGTFGSGAIAPGTLTEASMQYVGNGIYRCSISGTIGPTQTIIRAFVQPRPDAGIGFFPSWQGVAGSGILIWGLQLTQGAFPTSYIPTVGAAVTRAIDVCYVPTNASWYNPAAFSLLADWSDSPPSGWSGAVSGLSDGSFGNSFYFGPDGNANLGTTFVPPPTSTPQQPVSRTAINKAVTTFSQTRVGLSCNGLAPVFTAQTVLPFNAPTRLSIGNDPWSLTSAFNGHMRRAQVWSRALADSEMQAATTLAGPTLQLDFMSPGALDSRITFTRASAATYTDASGVIQTAAINTPRWDYAGGVLRGLLIEEQRTNLALASANIADSNWLVSAGTVAPPIVTGNQVAAPDGTISAGRVVYPAVSGAGAFSVMAQALSTNAVGYSCSVWLRGAVGGEQLYVMLATGTFYSVPVTLTTTWQRFTVTTPAVVGGLAYFQIGIDLRDGAQTAKPAQTVYVWGAQVEQGAFPTSYIPTVGAAATRAIDVATMPTNVSWYNQTAGSALVEFSDVPATSGGSSNGLLAFDDNNGNANNTLFMFSFNIPGQNVPVSQINIAGANSGYINYGATTTVPISKQITKWISNGVFAQTVNGLTVQTQTNTGMPGTISRLQIGPLYGGMNVLNGHMRRVVYWDRALSDTEMTKVTT